MKFLNHFMKTNGFTLIEMLFSLMIISLSILLITSSLSLIPKIMKEDEFIQDEIALSQLRHIALLSEDLYASLDTLEMRYLNQNIVIHQDGNRLIKEDGYEIMMLNLETIEFIESNGCVYLQYEKVNQHEEKKRFITCK